jgi:hypothetical protein
MYYIFNAEKKIIATCSSKPNQTDLASRNEFSVQSDLILSLENVGLDDAGNVIESQ